MTSSRSSKMQSLSKCSFQVSILNDEHTWGSVLFKPTPFALQTSWQNSFYFVILPGCFHSVSGEIQASLSIKIAVKSQRTKKIVIRYKWQDQKWTYPNEGNWKCGVSFLFLYFKKLLYESHSQLCSRPHASLFSLSASMP